MTRQIAAHKTTRAVRREHTAPDGNEDCNDDSRFLRLENRRFAVAFENMSHGICMFDAQERMIFCNGHYLRMFGLDREVVKPGITLRAILQQSVDVGVAPVSLEELYSKRKQYIDSREAADYAETLADGRVISISHRPLADGGWVSIYHDITEAQQGEDALREQNRRFEAALSNMSQGLLMFDVDGRLIVRNARYLEIFSLNPDDQPLGSSRRDMLQSLQDLGIYQDFDFDGDEKEHLKAIQTGRTISAHRKLSNGRTIAVSHLPMTGGGWVATFDDVTESQRAEASIRHMALHDALTDLANRAKFSARLEKALASSASTGEPLAVFSLDLDRFKAVNDTMGHPVGDQILKLVSDRLRSMVRDGDDTVARVGGDEFAIVLSNADKATADRWARRAAESIGKPYMVDGRKISIGSSVGIALAPEHGHGHDLLLKNADLALYRAKRESRNTHRFYEPEMDANLRIQNTLELDLREALARGELELHFQPILGATHGGLLGFEALMRWHRKDENLLAAADFIPLAEETHLIVPFGHWALNQACAEAVRWPGDLLLAVNVSPVQFRQIDFVASVAQALKASGLSAKRLELEIAEAVLMDPSGEVMRTIQALKGMGVRIALDDFGTGYSSLSHLRRYPLDRIKIDRSFIAEIDNADTAAFVAAIVGLGQRLGMSTTAEGVETAAQLELVRAASCSSVQGFLFSPAIPASEIPAMLGDTARFSAVA